MSLSGKRILVTGATGSLGRQVILELLARGIEPVAMVRASSDRGWLEAHGLEIREADLRHREALTEALRGIDLVIHTAAWVSFRGDRFTQFTGINTFGPREVFLAAKANGVQRVVHVSSVAAIGARVRSAADNGAPPRLEALLTEEHEWNLEHLRVPYILTKHAAEHELRLLATPDAPELVIVNPSMMLTEDPGLGRKKQLERLIGRPLLPEFRTRLNLVDVRDCAPAIVQALTDGRPGERYILAGDNVTVRELLLQLSLLGHRSPHLIRLPGPLLRLVARLAAWWTRVVGRARLRFYPDLVRLIDFDWIYSSAKAREELGFQPRALQESLRDIFAGEFLSEQGFRRSGR